MFYNVNLFIELLNFYSTRSKFLKDCLNKLLTSLFESKVFLAFKKMILPKKDSRGYPTFRALMGNTVEMAGGWHKYPLTVIKFNLQCTLNVFPSDLLMLLAADLYDWLCHFQNVHTIPYWTRHCRDIAISILAGECQWRRFHLTRFKITF